MCFTFKHLFIKKLVFSFRILIRTIRDKKKLFN